MRWRLIHRWTEVETGAVGRDPPSIGLIWKQQMLPQLSFHAMRACGRLDILVITPPAVGHCDLACRADQQLSSKMVFEFGNFPADRRKRHGQGPGGG